MNSDDITLRVYQKLSLRTNDVNIKDVGNLCDLTADEVLLAVANLQERNLVSRSGEFVRAVPWWNEDHLELLMNIPRVDQGVFQEYTSDLDSFSEDLQAKGIQALRPYSHETGIEIMLGAAAGLALAEFAKGFLGELGKKLAEFVGKMVERNSKSGITEVEIKAVRHSKKGGVDIAFSVRGRDREAILQQFAQLVKAIELGDKKFRHQNEIREEGEGWELLLRKPK